MPLSPEEALEAAQRKVARLREAQETAFTTGSHADWEEAHKKYLAALNAKDDAEWRVLTSRPKGV